jgi:hypothetical protein
LSRQYTVCHVRDTVFLCSYWSFTYYIVILSSIFFFGFYFRMLGMRTRIACWFLTAFTILTQLTMASKVEKTHALPPCCSTESLISSIGLGIFCLVADRFLRFPIIQHNDWLRAISDNIVHGVIGMWSWAVVTGIRKKSDFGEVLLAGFLASVIDVDHFFQARSLSLQVRHQCGQLFWL